MYKEAVQSSEKALGKEHPSVARSLYELAQLYQKLGRYEDAEMLTTRALHIQESTIGKTLII
jgi:tetratricopeptide (TPR) repeat protein